MVPEPHRQRSYVRGFVTPVSRMDECVSVSPRQTQIHYLPDSRERLCRWAWMKEMDDRQGWARGPSGTLFGSWYSDALYLAMDFKHQLPAIVGLSLFDLQLQSAPRTQCQAGRILS